MDTQNQKTDESGNPVIGLTTNLVGERYEVRFSKDGSWWMDLDRDGKFESNFRVNTVTGFLEVNEDNRGSFWTQCVRPDWLKCTDGSGG